MRRVLNCRSMAVRLVTLFSLVLVPFLRGQLSNTPMPDFWAADAPVRCIVETNGLIYIGGDFHYVGWPTGGWTVDLTSGARPANYPKIDGRVLAVVDDQSGGWYIGGEFTHIGTNNCSHIAHLLPDGSPDTNWLFGADNTVST